MPWDILKLRWRQRAADISIPASGQFPYRCTSSQVFQRQSEVFLLETRVEDSFMLRTLQRPQSSELVLKWVALTCLRSVDKALQKLLSLLFMTGNKMKKKHTFKSTQLCILWNKHLNVWNIYTWHWSCIAIFVGICKKVTNFDQAANCMGDFYISSSSIVSRGSMTTSSELVW